MTKIGQVLRKLPRPALIVLPDGQEVDWLAMFEASAREAEGEGRYSSADETNRKYLEALLRDGMWASPSQRRRPGVVNASLSMNQFARLANVIKKVGLATDPAYDDDRMILLGQIHRWVAYEFAGGETVPLGLPSDLFPDSRRSVYRQIWRELNRLHGRGQLDKFVESAQGGPMLERIRNKWPLIPPTHSAGSSRPSSLWCQSRDCQ